jgi:signal peptidase II
MRERLGPLTAALATLLLDQATKLWVLSELPEHASVPYGPFFNLVRVGNRGVAFGLLSGLSPERSALILSGLSLAASAAVLAWMWRLPGDSPGAYGLSLVLGGAVGNVIDRLRLGAVTDFLDLHWGGAHWPAFNVADVAICAGVALLVLELWREERERKEDGKGAGGT